MKQPDVKQPLLVMKQRVKAALRAVMSALKTNRQCIGQGLLFCVGSFGLLWFLSMGLLILWIFVIAIEADLHPHLPAVLLAHLQHLAADSDSVLFTLTLSLWVMWVSVTQLIELRRLTLSKDKQ